MNTQNWRNYRILDNQYLGTLFQVGVIGLISYLAIVVFGMVTAHGVIRRAGVRAPPALAASAGCAAFGLLSATYDAAAFPQAVYSFLFVAGMVAALGSKQPQVRPEPSSGVQAGNTSTGANGASVDGWTRSRRAVAGALCSRGRRWVAPS